MRTEEFDFWPDCLPDVPDGRFCLPDGPKIRRTAAGFESAAPEHDPPPEGPMVVEGKLAVGPMRSPRENSEAMENPGLSELLARVDRSPEVVAEVVDGAKFSAIDADPLYETIRRACRAHRVGALAARDAALADLLGRGVKLRFCTPDADGAEAGTAERPSAKSVKENT